ncbi:hypothetical protein WOLCODRAFT_138718 [Wolfiporia cocos MD-104 SS10]|uniref:C2H2-type domain-containing protein n=1 Tax=Wolfiporia cocos (strain MD-104) TaxID=742152 RepID=A0A2H3JP95_WOLCO|nr:hypothetical protein WOLCODRAFT_138718 [Wolfiporia cocos MD-104 SS10]
MPQLSGNTLIPAISPLYHSLIMHVDYCSQNGMLVAHLSTHVPPVGTSCPHCGRIFANATLTHDHIQQQHGFPSNR